jgi:hypothetical protein
MSPAAVIRLTSCWTPALWRGSVVRMKSSNEMSSRCQTSRNSAGHAVAVRERILAELPRLAEDVLRVLVVAHHEVHVVAGQALVAGDDVGGDLLVRRAEVGAAVDVVDGGRQVEGSHSICHESSQAFRASACTSLMGRPCSARQPGAVVELRGGIQHAAAAARDLDADRTNGRLDRPDLAVEHVASHLVVAHADRRRLGEQQPAIASRRSDGASTVTSVPGRFFFIWTGT